MRGKKEESRAEDYGITIEVLSASDSRRWICLDLESPAGESDTGLFFVYPLSSPQIYGADVTKWVSDGAETWASFLPGPFPKPLEASCNKSRSARRQRR